MIRARLSERVTRVRAVTISGRDRLEIIWIDQAPLRANAAAECTDMMVRLERARLGWHQFERQDNPAFVRWRAREFGALLSTARDVEDRIRDAQNLIHEVEIEMRRRSRIRTAPIGACCFGAKIRASPMSGRLSLMDRDRHLI